MTQQDERTGLYRKFLVYRTDGRDKAGEKHEGCMYFVLDLDHDRHAAAAINAYYLSCKDEYPELAEHLSEWLGGAKKQTRHRIHGFTP